MDATAQDQQDRIGSTGERPVKLDNLMDQPLLPNDERIVSANPSPDAAIMGHARDVSKQPEYSHAGGDVSIVQPLHVFTPQDQNFAYGGYDSSTGTWDGYSHFVSADGFHVLSPVIYNDNPSLMFHSGYGFNSDMAYGQYPSVASPMPPMMVDGQLYPSQQIPFSQSYYPQPAPPSMPHISSSIPVPPMEMMTPESSSSDSMLYGPGSGYMLHFGSFGGGNLPGNMGSSSLASPSVYPQPIGILGSYEHNTGQFSQQQRPLYGMVSSNSTGRYPHSSSYQNSHLGNTSISYDHNRLGLDKGQRRERDRDSVYISNSGHDISVDRNRGPRATKLKGKSTSEQGPLSAVSGNEASVSGLHLDLYNRLDFVTDYEKAKFFIIKSFSEDNVHKSIKYNVWASTPHGNKKLDAAYREAKEIDNSCPIFLLFSVNGSGQFCGVAEMVGPVDFEKDADYWQQDRWSGQFPVHWHIIKDIPNNRFRHILLENNDNKPVTHSRDSQEVKLEHGIEMLRIFKHHDARTSILDDFNFYDERERALKDRKARQFRGSSVKDVPDSLTDESVNQISDSFGQTLHLEDSKVPTTTTATTTETELEENGREAGTGSQK